MRNGQGSAKPLAKGYLEFRDHHGRVLAIEELSALITTTWDGPVRFGMTGPERSMLYRLASEIPLTVEDLRRLTPASFQLGDSPTVTVVAGSGVRCRKQVLPLRPETTEDLGSFLIVPELDQPIFRIPDELPEMLRADMQAAERNMSRGGDTEKTDADCDAPVAPPARVCGHD